MAVLGLCSGTACSSDTDETVLSLEQQPSNFVASARSAGIDHLDMDELTTIRQNKRTL